MIEFNNGQNILGRNKTVFEEIIFNGEIKEINSFLGVAPTVHFLNCTFKGSLYIKGIKTKNLSFSNCEFEREVTLDSLESQSLYIDECTFSQEIKLTELSIEEYFSIRNCMSYYNVSITGNYKSLQIESLNAEKSKVWIYRINEGVVYDNRPSICFSGDCRIKILALFSEINADLTFMDKGFFEEISLQNGFKQRVLFLSQLHCNHLHVWLLEVSDKFYIRSGTFDKISFEESIFQERAKVEILDKGTRYGVLIVKELTISECSFEKDVFLSCKGLKNIELSNNTPKKIIKVHSLKSWMDEDYGSVVKLILKETTLGEFLIQDSFVDIYLTGVGLGSINLKNVNVSGTSISNFHNKGTLSFLNCICSGCFAINNSIAGYLVFINSNINDFSEIVIYNSFLEDVYFNTYPYKIKSQKIGDEIKLSKKESLRNLKDVYNQLKQIARKRGSIDISNKYLSLEYQNLLKLKKFGADKILLCLNFASNKFGESWVIGIVFTLGISLIFFTIYYFGGLGENLENNLYLKDYILFLTSYPRLELGKFEELNQDWNIQLTIWLARIFVSFGIYQTIAAFRKYLKK